MSGSIAPIHPGEVLREEFLEPINLAVESLAHAVGVPLDDISELVLERRGLTGELALRLAAYFETTPEFWLNLQSHFDLETARDRLGPEIDSLPRRDRTR